MGDIEEAHCDGADFLDVPNYPHSRADADLALKRCRNLMVVNLKNAVKAAASLVDESNIVQEKQLAPSCIFIWEYADDKNKALCKTIGYFGFLLHASEDFYSHSNWADRSFSSAPDWKRLDFMKNPPGLGNKGIPCPFLDLRVDTHPKIPAGLITGCYPEFECIMQSRVPHEYLNKDKGIITIAETVTAGDCTTYRCNTGDPGFGNFESSVKAAVLDTRDKWATLREKLEKTYGVARASVMACAITSASIADALECSKPTVAV
jgi:hypothetical protein